MTQRSERWLIVGICIVLYVLAMGAFVWLTNPFLDWLQLRLIAAFGSGGALLAIFAPLIALCAWATWRERHLPPTGFKQPQWPRWVRVAGNLYLGAIAFCVVVGMGTFIAVALMR